MGAFADYIEVLRDGIGGDSPLGGTLFPTSEGFPCVPGIFVQGSTFPVPTLEVLADLPYKTLVLDMEVIVSEHERPGPITHPRTVYKLTTLPPADTKVSEVSGYVLSDYWTAIAEPEAQDGEPGDKGWTPVYVVESDGVDRSVLRIIDYAGGEGVKPDLPVATSSYLGSSGYTTKSLAANIKGEKGNTGSSANVRPLAVFSQGGFSVLIVTSVAIPNTETMLENLQISNTHTASRQFLVRGWSYFKESIGGSHVIARLRLRSSGSNLPTTTSSSLKDSNTQRVDIGDPDGYPMELHKIQVECVITIGAGQTVDVGISVERMNSNTGTHTIGVIQAIGL
jgi:hypothetical protein